jgi:O-antigen ligase
VLIIGGYTLVPQTGNQRALSGIAALRGHPTDSSARDRINRAQNAFDEMLAVPLGNGWTSAGWVHSDFIQVGANLGVAAGLIFLGGYLFTLARLFRRVLSERAAGHADIEVALFLSFISAGGILATQGVEVLPQLILPVWFVWVLVEVWLIRSASSYKAGAQANALALEGYQIDGAWYGAPFAGSPGLRQ